MDGCLFGYVFGFSKIRELNEETLNSSADFLRILRNSAGEISECLFPAELRRIRRKSAEINLLNKLFK